MTGTMHSELISSPLTLSRSFPIWSAARILLLQLDQDPLPSRLNHVAVLRGHLALLVYDHVHSLVDGYSILNVTNVLSEEKNINFGMHFRCQHFAFPSQP
jgi:hypothetical protein